MQDKFRLTEVWCEFALLFIFGAFYVAAMPLPQESRQFPQLLAVASLAMTAIALVMGFARKGTGRREIAGVDDTELTVLDADARRARRKRYYQAWAIILVSTGVGLLGGFLFSALCLFSGFALFFGSRQKLARGMIIGVAMTIVVYLVFGVVMGVPLLEGLLT
ncbi:MAG: tripartite tricarboxylate transporter TctB family protein [Betaproteobacteria bacterium]|nr:tripartite tricarboxylate transporter TctB family protein [Betaproteobacteria bacterium]